MRTKIFYGLSFLAGGIIFSICTFFTATYFLGNFMADAHYSSQSYIGEQSLKIIERINAGDNKKAILSLEQNIYFSAISLEECFEKSCPSRNAKNFDSTLKKMQDYQYEQFTP